MTTLRELLSNGMPQIVAGLSGKYQMYVIVSLYLIVATLSVISDGMHFGWSAPVIPILQLPNSHILISKNDEKWLETIYLIGGIFGIPTFLFMMKLLGRKKSIIVTSCVSLISWFLIGVASNISFLYTARFLAGMTVNAGVIAIPVYLAEIAEQQIRGFIVSFIGVMNLLGILIIYSVAPFVSFFVPSVIGILLILTQIVTFSFMPESPYYLLLKNKEEEAKNALNRLRTNKNNNEAEFEEIAVAAIRQKQEQFFDLFINKSNRKAFFIIIILSAGTHIGGSSIMTMNINTIFDKTHSTYLNPSTASILFSFSMFFSVFLSSFFIDKHGRKFLLIISSVVTSLCLLVFAIYYHLLYLNYNLDLVSWIPITTAVIYAVGARFGLELVPIVIASELFPAKMKAIGMTVNNLLYLSFAILSIEIYKQLSLSYGNYVPFYVFAIGCILILGVCVVYLPETKQKTLEQIQHLLKEESKSDNKIYKPR